MKTFIMKVILLFFFSVPSESTKSIRKSKIKCYNPLGRLGRVKCISNNKYICSRGTGSKGIWVSMNIVCGDDDELKQTEFFIITSSFQGAQCKVQWENPQNEGCGDQGPFPIPRMGHSVEYDPDDNCGDATTACNVTTRTCAPITETQPIPNLKIVEVIAGQCAVEEDHNSDLAKPGGASQTSGRKYGVYMKKLFRDIKIIKTNIAKLAASGLEVSILIKDNVIKTCEFEISFNTGICNGLTTVVGQASFGSNFELGVDPDNTRNCLITLITSTVTSAVGGEDDQIPCAPVANPPQPPSTNYVFEVNFISTTNECFLEQQGI